MKSRILTDEDSPTQSLAKAVVRKSDLEFRRLLSRLPTAAYTCDAEGLITFFNQHAVDLWSREPKLNDPADRFCGSFNLFTTQGVPIPHDKCWMALALLNRQEYNGLEIIIERPDGERRTVLAHANPIVEEDGNLAGAVNVLVDITEQQRAAELQRDDNRRKDEFLAMLAHELRNPLTPIRSGLDILDIETEGQSEVIGQMKLQVQHVVRLVDDLLDVSRILRGRVQLRTEAIELSTVVKRAREMVRDFVDEQEQTLEVCLPDAPIWLHADPVRFVQIIENLLKNALKYTLAGGHIQLIAEVKGKEAFISVCDDGIGIETDLVPGVFDLFTQSSRSLDRAQGGMGIGLTLVRSLVEMHGGSIVAHSDGPGKGSRFDIRMPLGTPVESSTSAVATPLQKKGCRVLVVDDNKGAANMLSTLLSKLGPYQVEICYDGPSAIARVADYAPDVVLLDIGLPGMDGFAVCQEIRTNAKLDNLLLVALTGYGRDDYRSRSLAIGFDEFLIKPPSMEVLENILNHPKMK